jgi:L-alanine-DL-glutamate epimerase-like enolase superfamily enzyme
MAGSNAGRPGQRWRGQLDITRLTFHAIRAPSKTTAIHPQGETDHEDHGITARTFVYKSYVGRDDEGHTHPGDEHDAEQVLVTVKTDEGAEGYAFGGAASVIENTVHPIVVDEDPSDREKIWQKLRHMQRISPPGLTDRQIGVVDLALHDLAGRHLNMPAHKLLGGSRDKVLAYASTMCGDEMPGGLATPEDYGRFAEWAVKERGYKAFKLHTWMPPIASRGRPTRRWT